MSFEWKFFVRRHVSILGFQNRVCLSVPREKKSPWLRQYQSYISNWFINGKVFTITTAWKPQFFFFFFFSRKFEIDEIEFCQYLEKRNRPGFVDICPTLVIDASMERSSRVLQHWNPKSWIFSENFKIDEIEFCPYPEKRNRPGFVDISPSLVIDT